MPWQLRALDYYDRIGEIRYASQFYAKQLSRVLYFPARLNEDGTVDPITEGLPVDLLNRLQDPGGGRSQLQYAYGRLMFITGEGVLFGSRIDTPQERWRFLWKDEVEFRDGSVYRLDIFRQPIESGEGYRLWNPSPRHSDEADAPLRSILDIAEELLILTAGVRATAVTRLTNGLMILPQEISFGAAEPVGDEDPQNDPFLQDYTEHVEHQIEDPWSAGSKVPFTITPPYDYADRVQWIKTHDPATDYMEKDLRMEAIKRLALGLDMPPEWLLGMTDANHWTAKQVQHDIWRSHGMPQAERFADDVNEAYLRPMLIENEYPDWERVVIGYDDSQVVISPDRTEDADKALDRIAISRDYYRKLKGFTDVDAAPDEQEEEFLASLKLRAPVQIEDGELVLPQRGPVPSANGSNPENGPPAPTGSRTGSRQEARTASILGAARLALYECRRKAGSRLRRHQQKCGECVEMTDGVANALVASVLGQEKVSELADPLRLVAGGADGFEELVASEIDETQARSLKQMLEVYAAKTLCQPETPSLPSGFVAHVEKAGEVTDALAS